MLTIGIDPGNTGAVAAYDGGTPSTHMLPWLPGKAGVDVLDVAAWIDSACLLAGVERPAVVAVESVTSFGMGRQSAFNFGAGVGDLRTLCRLMGWRLERPTPTAWQRATMGRTSKGDKRMAVGWARDRWPGMRWERAKAKQEGQADAAGMALWAWQVARSE